MVKNIVIIGGSGAIGRAFTLELSISYPNATIHAFSRHQLEKVLLNVKYHTIDYQDETSIEKICIDRIKRDPTRYGHCCHRYFA